MSLLFGFPLTGLAKRIRLAPPRSIMALEYKNISAEPRKELWELDRLVNAAIQLGWVPQGNPVFNQGAGQWSQAMVKGKTYNTHPNR
jgi:hypothetical protein